MARSSFMTRRAQERRRLLEQLLSGGGMGIQSIPPFEPPFPPTEPGDIPGMPYEPPGGGLPPDTGEGPLPPGLIMPPGGELPLPWEEDQEQQPPGMPYPPGAPWDKWMPPIGDIPIQPPDHGIVPPGPEPPMAPPPGMDWDFWQAMASIFGDDPEVLTALRDFAISSGQRWRQPRNAQQQLELAALYKDLGQDDEAQELALTIIGKGFARPTYDLSAILAPLAAQWGWQTRAR